MFFLVFDTGLGLQVISAYIKMLLINPVLPHKYFTLGGILAVLALFGRCRECL